MEEQHDLAELESLLGYRFRNPSLLQRALTHSSFWNERNPARRPPGDNEALELLGDSVLGLTVTQFLLNRFADWSVGRLSQARARLVSARSLHAAALPLQLGEHLLLGRGQEKTGLRSQRDVLADTYEALVAAVFLDGGLDAASQFVVRTLLEPALREDTESLGEPDDKWALMEWLRANEGVTPQFALLREEGPDHRKVFCVAVSVRGQTLATAEAGNKKEAEQLAARLALDALRSGAMRLVPAVQAE